MAETNQDISGEKKTQSVGIKTESVISQLTFTSETRESTLNAAMILAKESDNSISLAEIHALKEKFGKDDSKIKEWLQANCEIITEEARSNLQALGEECLSKIDKVKKGEYDKQNLSGLVEFEKINSESTTQAKQLIITALETGFIHNATNDTYLLHLNEKFIQNGVSDGLGVEIPQYSDSERKLEGGKIVDINNSEISTEKIVSTSDQDDKSKKDEGEIDPLTQQAKDADKSKKEHDKKLAQRQNNPYYSEQEAEIRINPSIQGNYNIDITSGSLYKRNIHGENIGNLRKGEEIKINSYEITLGGKKFYQAEGADKKLFYVAAEYLTKQEENKEKTPQEVGKKLHNENHSEALIQELQESEDERKKQSPQEVFPTERQMKEANIADSLVPLETISQSGKFAEMNGKILNEVIDNGEKTLGDMKLKYIKNSDRIRCTIGDVTFTLRVSELSQKEGRRTFYLPQSELQSKFEKKYNHSLSEQNTEKAEKELSKIQEQIEKITMKTSDFFSETIKPQEKAWVNTFSGSEVTLNNISVIKDAQGNTVITFDIDDRLINDEINSNFVVNLGTGSFDELLFKAQLVNSLQKRIIPKKS